METLRILFLGDVCGAFGVKALCAHLPALRRETGAELVVVNAENAAPSNGITKAVAEELFFAGADVLTGGNHSFRKKESYEFLDSEPRVLRPANFPATAPGVGYGIYPCANYRVLVLNLMGNAFLDPTQNIFECADAVLAREAGAYDFAVCDLHAEATAEKGAFARDFDGRFAAIVGTHTHIPTADAQILPGGSAFVTDLGMCGPEVSVLGVRVQDSITRFRTRLPVYYAEGEGDALIQGVFVRVDPKTGKALEIRQILNRYPA